MVKGEPNGIPSFASTPLYAQAQYHTEKIAERANPDHEISGFQVEDIARADAGSAVLTGRRRSDADVELLGVRNSHKGDGAPPLISNKLLDQALRKPCAITLPSSASAPVIHSRKCDRWLT